MFSAESIILPLTGQARRRADVAARQQFSKAWATAGKLRQAISETDLWPTPSRRGKMAV